MYMFHAMLVIGMSDESRVNISVNNLLCETIIDSSQKNCLMLWTSCWEAYDHENILRKAHVCQVCQQTSLSDLESAFHIYFRVSSPYVSISIGTVTSQVFLSDQLCPVALILQILKAGNVSYQLYPLHSECCIRWRHTNQVEDEGADSREKQAICHQTHQKVLHIASGQWPKTHCQFCQGVYQGKEMESFRLPKQSPDLNPIEHEFHQLKRRLKAEQVDGISCFKGWETHSKGWDQESGDVYGSQIHCCDCTQGICN